MSLSIVLVTSTWGIPDQESVLLMGMALGLVWVAAVALYHTPVRLHAHTAFSYAWTRWLRPQSGRTEPTHEPRDAGTTGEPSRIAVIGYTTVSARKGMQTDDELAKQAEVISRACDRLGLALVEVAGDPRVERGLFRPKAL